MEYAKRKMPRCEKMTNRTKTKHVLPGGLLIVALHRAQPVHLRWSGEGSGCRCYPPTRCSPTPMVLPSAMMAPSRRTVASRPTCGALPSVSISSMSLPCGVSCAHDNCAHPRNGRFVQFSRTPTPTEGWMWGMRLTLCENGPGY